jgi:hypothetical protein
VPLYRAPVAVASGTANIKQTEIDFGADPIHEKSFTVTDADVSGTSQLIAFQASEAATSKDADENEMDALALRVKPGSGEFTLFASGLEGRVYGAFKINYLVG